ncbi:methyl-accepting chemotaxis protein [Haloglomus salinum]|uniref:methyl-accepting chemotaxis protein n=1 Tax=Haloglomus salinum TaxID=2962673 RepID=UPI0020C9DACB|nr:methyl-accepting chemotaxis protein [Haloglomus salinum]
MLGLVERIRARIGGRERYPLRSDGGQEMDGGESAAVLDPSAPDGADTEEPTADSSPTTTSDQPGAADAVNGAAGATNGPTTEAGPMAAAGHAQLLDAVGVPAFVLDADGTVAGWNDAIVELTGATREEAIGHAHVSELFYPDGRRAKTLADKVTEAPQRAASEFGVGVKDPSVPRYGDTSTMVDQYGDEKHIDFHATPLYDGDEFVGVLEVVIDRTEEVREREAVEALVGEVRDTAHTIGEGDLDARVSREDEFAALDDDLLAVVTAVNEMADNLADLVAEVTEQTHELETGAEAATSAAEAISTTVTEQNESLEESVHEIRNFSAGMEEVAATADRVNDATTTAREAATDGLEASEEAREATTEVVEIGDELAESVAALDEKMDDIEAVTEIIADVAEQTNLLALNANIEAARAGEEGAGFAVVAEEVKNLADQTQAHTEEIGESLAELQSRTDATAAATERSHDRIEEAEDSLSEVFDSLEAIAEEVDEAADGVAEVARTTDDQAARIEEVTSTLEATLEQSEHAGDRAADIVSVTEEQSQRVDALANYVADLSVDGTTQ